MQIHLAFDVPQHVRVLIFEEMTYPHVRIVFLSCICVRASWVCIYNEHVCVCMCVCVPVSIYSAILSFGLIVIGCKFEVVKCVCIKVMIRKIDSECTISNGLGILWQTPMKCLFSLLKVFAMKKHRV